LLSPLHMMEGWRDGGMEGWRDGGMDRGDECGVSCIVSLFVALAGCWRRNNDDWTVNDKANYYTNDTTRQPNERKQRSQPCTSRTLITTEGRWWKPRRRALPAPIKTAAGRCPGAHPKPLAIRLRVSCVRRSYTWCRYVGTSVRRYVRRSFRRGFRLVGVGSVSSARLW
jgi:hypothetical protein